MRVCFKLTGPPAKVECKFQAFVAAWLCQAEFATGANASAN
jgi:hypothetical protein